MTRESCVGDASPALGHGADRFFNRTQLRGATDNIASP